MAVSSSQRPPYMQLHLHPTRHEALTISDTDLTRWSLETNPATILARMSTAPESMFIYTSSPQGHLHTSCGGITGSPNGLLFTMQQLSPERYRSPDPWVLEWRHWDDFSLARTSTVPDTSGDIGKRACSPDGRWLVLGSADRLYLLDWQTGELLSSHAKRESYGNSLTFDATSTFVAQAGYDDCYFLELWRLDRAEQFTPRAPAEYFWPTHAFVAQDEVIGHMALTPVPVHWGQIGMDWPSPSLADAPGGVAFSSDNRLLLFSLQSTIEVGGYALVAFEMPAARVLWGAQQDVQSAGQPIFNPESRQVLVPMQDGSLVVYNAENGTLMQQLPTSLNESIQGLAFDHDGRTLWLATEERLVAYQPPR